MFSSPENSEGLPEPEQEEQATSVVVFPTVHSEVEAYKLYCDYAHHTGFSVRKQHIWYWTHTRIIKIREYSCSKAGLKRSLPIVQGAEGSKKYHKLDTRTGCKACIQFTADIEGKNWRVTKFVEEHNHPLVLEKDIHLLRSNRKVSDDQGSLLKNLTGVGIRTSDAYRFIAGEVGGFENVGFSKSDAYNYVQRERAALIESGDSNSLLKLFKDRQMDDSLFSFDVQTDEFNRLTSFVWMDGHSKIDYDNFGDVIIFDTTYRLNKYNLACAPFIAVNHHWQNVFIGGAFIAAETIESFCWVFETFLRFVGGKQPTTIFTDQDQAMAVAIARVFNSSLHRLCQWHISKKAPSKVPTFNHDKSIRSLFYNCMSKCDTEAEFDANWTAMISKGHLENNRWLEDLHKVRSKWSTAFNNDILDLGILSTQRSESANNGLHGCSKATSSLVDCFNGMEKLISSCRRSEQEEDFRCKEGSITLKFKNCLHVKQASKLYTRKMFSIFEKLYIEGAISVSIIAEIQNTDNEVLFVTRHCDGAEHDKQWIVKVDSTTFDAECSCKGFETKGMLCQHILKVYISKNLKQINPKYMIKRFTRTAKQGLYFSKTPCMNVVDSNVVFRSHLMRFTYELARKVENCNAAKEHVIKVMTELGRTTEEMVERGDTKRNGSVVDEKEGKEHVRNPAAVRPKGLSNARLKSHFEKPTKRSKKKINHMTKPVVNVDNDEIREINFIGSCTFEGESASTQFPTSDYKNDDLCLSLPLNFSCVPDVLKG